MKTGSEKLIVLIKTAYWVGLLIIAAMAMASYVLLQQMMAAQQRDQAILSLASTQKALSQRVVFLAGAVDAANLLVKPQLLKSLKTANKDFETNYDLLLDGIAADPSSLERLHAGSIENILFAKPYHLDYFSIGLAANGWRFIAAVEGELNDGKVRDGFLAGKESAHLDATVANATLAGYTALGERINALADSRLQSMLSVHKMLFYATIGIIVLVALFIFRPMSDVILRKTHELVDARNSMAFIAVHDSLTGLHNRTFLTENFDTLIKGAQRRGEQLAVLQLDLDRFKEINDTLGHSAGDHVLTTTAQRLREACTPSDLCVRLGGDEFVVILSDAGDRTDDVARQILSRIREPIHFEGATILPGASAGIAVYPVDADNATDLIVHADLALYSAKKHGGGAFMFFSEELRLELDYRKQLEHDLKSAIADRTFSVFFQPQISMSKGTITGVEALMRWKHSERGMISPAEFIPVAEKSGLMPQIGRIVVSKAIHEAADWHRAGIEFGRLSVNVSGTELREPDFSTFLFDTLRAADLPVDKLALEIVESVILDDEKTGIATKLRDIRAGGVHLELDDFGTGYASLSHVNPKEIDRLKIDRRFVQNIDGNDDNSKIVRALTELARGLGIAIIAEGAETEAELNSLLALGCDQVQGYSIAFPMPASEARTWLTIRGARKPALTVLKGSRA